MFILVTSDYRMLAIVWPRTSSSSRLLGGFIIQVLLLVLSAARSWGRRLSLLFLWNSVTICVCTGRLSTDIFVRLFLVWMAS